MKPEKPSGKERDEHIIRSVKIIQSFTENHTRDGFLKDQRTNYAILNLYVSTGKAKTNINSGIPGRNDYSWRRVSVIKNNIMHAYQANDKGYVWNTPGIILPGYKYVDDQFKKGIFVNEVAHEQYSKRK